MRIEVSGVLSSWLTAETKSCCWRASRICPTAKRYINKKPPHSTTASVTATHASSAVPGARGSASTTKRELDVAERRRQPRAMEHGAGRVAGRRSIFAAPRCERSRACGLGTPPLAGQLRRRCSRGKALRAPSPRTPADRRARPARSAGRRARRCGTGRDAPCRGRPARTGRLRWRTCARVTSTLAASASRASASTAAASARTGSATSASSTRFCRSSAAKLARCSSNCGARRCRISGGRRPPLRPRAPRLRLLPKRRAPAPRRPVTIPLQRDDQSRLAPRSRLAPMRGCVVAYCRRSRRARADAAGASSRSAAHELIARQQLAQLRDPRRARRLLGRRDAIACGVHTRLRQQRRREPAGGIDLKIAEHAGHGARDGKLQTAASAARSSRRRRPRPRGTSRRRTSARPRPQWPLATSRRLGAASSSATTWCCETPDT